jgi:hypothetical protein
MGAGVVHDPETGRFAVSMALVVEEAWTQMAMPFPFASIPTLGRLEELSEVVSDVAALQAPCAGRDDACTTEPWEELVCQTSQIATALPTGLAATLGSAALKPVCGVNV